MMNYGYLFYKRYYDGIDLRRFDGKNDRDKVSNRNKIVWEGEKGRNDGRDREGRNALFYKPAQLSTPPVLPVTLSPVELETAYPGLLLGSGYSHETGSEGEFKIGFFFDHATGLPVMPGSSIKGVLRNLFPQFKKDDNQLLGFDPPSPAQQRRAKVIASLLKKEAGLVLSENEADLHRALHRLELDIFESVDVTASLTERKLKYRPLAERDIFFDAFPVQADGEGKLFAPDFLTPHTDGPLKNPTPLQFLKVRPGVRFRFAFRLRDTQFEGVVLNTEQKRKMFLTLLEHLGAGAKTNVGYGALVEPGKAATQTPPPAGTGAKTPVVKAKSLEKWKPNDPLTGRLAEIRGKEAFFETDQITDCEWRLYVPNMPNPDQLEMGKTYSLSFSQALKKQSLIQVKLVSIKPL